MASTDDRQADQDRRAGRPLIEQLLLDEQWSHRIAEQLRCRGLDVVAVAERRELPGTSDPDLLRVAHREERVLVTENVRDFAVLHKEFLAAGKAHSGLILVPPGRYLSDSGIARMIADLDELVRAREDVGVSESEGLWL